MCVGIPRPWICSWGQANNLLRFSGASQLRNRLLKQLESPFCFAIVFLLVVYPVYLPGKVIGVFIELGLHFFSKSVDG